MVVSRSMAALSRAIHRATVEADRESLRQALQRTAILSNEKYRGFASLRVRTC